MHLVGRTSFKRRKKGSLILHISAEVKHLQTRNFNCANAVHAVEKRIFYNEYTNIFM